MTSPKPAVRTGQATSVKFLMVDTFIATCGVCGAGYEHLAMPSEASLRAGTFCPACKDRGRLAPGILHWEYHPDRSSAALPD